jgi:hypothetical protein
MVLYTIWRRSYDGSEKPEIGVETEIAGTNAEVGDMADASMDEAEFVDDGANDNGDDA